MAIFSVHFDGPITTDHKVPVRVLGKTYTHMQCAIDRAFLITEYGEVWKHARLTDEQYAITEFLASYPREGGIILDAIREGADAIIDRIAGAIAPLYENAIQQGFDEHDAISQQYQDRLDYVNGMRRNVETFEELVQEPPAGWATAYSNKSVVKEIDQMVNQISPDRLDGSTIEITLVGSRANLPFEFDADRAKRFHKLTARKELGRAIIVTAIIRSLDRGNRYTKPNGKVLNLGTNREVVLRMQSIDDFEALHEYHNGEPVEIFACPIVEAGGFDVNGGDLMFISVV